MNSPTDGRVLLVGEGNFSLSASLVSSGTLSGPQVVTSCLDTRGTVEDTHRLAASNIALLEEAGAMVLFEVDARELHNHPEIRFFEFSRIIFNFPLADRHNIKRNRALLSEFFNSAVRVLNRETGQVMVTLCKGQGGTPADQPMRSWHDSWQVVSIATDAGLILTEVRPFQAEDLRGYKSVGFRFQDKGFNTENALIHVFEVAATVRASDGSGRRCFLRQNEEDFAVPAYIRRKLDSWSLLEKENHPVASLHQHILAKLQGDGPVTTLLTNDSHLPRVLPDYRSFLSVKPESRDSGETADPDMDVDTEEMTVDEVSTSKDLKEMMNRACAAATAAAEAVKKLSSGEAMEMSPKSFQHGVDRGEDSNQQGQKGDEKAQSSRQFDVSSGGIAALVSSPFLMPVYVVHKVNPPSPTVPSTQPSGGHSGVECVNQAQRSVENGSEGQADSDITSVGVEGGRAVAADIPTATENITSAVPAKETTLQNSDVLSGADFTPSSSLLHLRSSLLENVPHLLGFMKQNPAKHQIAAMSGIVFRKCSISPAELPASHETLVLSVAKNETGDEFGKKLLASVKDAVSSDQKFCMQATDCKVNVGEHGQAEIVSTLTGLSLTGMTVLGHVFKYESARGSSVRDHGRDSETVSPTQASDSTAPSAQAPDYNTASKTGSEPIGSEPVFGAVLYLDTIASLALCLPDIRLLWSEDHRFISQFRKEHQPPLPLPVFKPFSLYPVRFVHDLSFWENPDGVFEEPEFFDIVREVADDIVVKVTLIDKFDSTETGKTSRCYRLVFQSHDRALSYITSWKLQSMIRLKVAHNLGVTLR